MMNSEIRSAKVIREESERLYLELQDGRRIEGVEWGYAHLNNAPIGTVYGGNRPEFMAKVRRTFYTGFGGRKPMIRLCQRIKGLFSRDYKDRLDFIDIIMKSARKKREELNEMVGQEIRIEVVKKVV